MSNESYKSEISSRQLATAHRGDRTFGANPMAEYEERIAELEADLSAARDDLARYVAGIDAERENGRQVLTRLTLLLDEWERADCTSSTRECAEQVRAILRGEGPQGWEQRAGKEDQ